MLNPVLKIYSAQRLITIHILKIYNQDGEIIEEINAGDIAEFFGNYYEAKIVLQNIFREARRIAKGSYKAIEDILKSLD